MNEKLVSIIVPVYNMEKYLPRCLDSLVAQTYRNLQIIVVNDGSSDNSKLVIENYQKRDSRIEVHDKTNGGVADTRNYALNCVRGEYVCFVDPDDWIADDYIDTLYALFADGIDITCGGFEYCYDNGKREVKERMKKINLSAKQAMQVLCDGTWMTNHLWNKMYRTHLFRELRFETGRCYEDIFIMHLLFSKIKKIACTDKIIYYYFMREDSIIHQKGLQNYLDNFMAYYARYQFLEDEHLKKKVLRFCAWDCYQILYLLEDTSESSRDLKVVKQFWKVHQEIGKLGIKYFILYHFPKMYRMLLVR